MSKIVLQNGIIKGIERNLFGWSIANILFATSALAIINAALLQYIVLSALSGQFQKVFEQEVSAKTLAQLDNNRVRFSRAMQSQNSAILRSVAQDVLALDSGYQMVLFYDGQGKYNSFFQKENVPLELVKSLSQTAGLRSLQSSASLLKLPAITIVKAKEQRTLDALFSVDSKQDGANASSSSRFGYVRLLVSLSKVDEKLFQMRFWGAVLVIFTTGLSTILFLLTIRKTVISPIERAVALMEQVVANVERIPPLELKDTDALQVKKLMRTLHSGLVEVSVRQRSSDLFDKTRKMIEARAGDGLFSELKSLWISTKLGTNCHVLVAQKAGDGAFVINGTLGSDGVSGGDETSAKANPGKRQTQRFDLQKDLMLDAVTHFLEREVEMDWTEQWLLVKVPMQIVTEKLMLVLALVPNEKSGLTPDRFEELSLTWLSEVARLYQVVRYRSLAGDIEISRELRRKLLQFVPTRQEDDGSELEAVAACDSHSGSQGLGDFVFVSNLPAGRISVCVVGTVSGSDFRSGLVASCLVAALADRFQMVRTAEAQRIMKNFVSAANNYLWNNYKGKMTATCTIIVFDHENGLGTFVCYGGRQPFLFTPLERKPLVVAQTETCSSLGISESYNFLTTSFPVIPGQFVLAGSPGLLDLENGEGQRFEKFVLAGGLSELVDNSYLEHAKIVTQRVFDSARKFSGSQVVLSDMTALILMRYTGTSI